MGVYGWGRQGHYRTMYRVYVMYTYYWFPWIWYDLIREEYVIGLPKPLTREVLKHRVSEKEAEAFRKLLAE